MNDLKFHDFSISRKRASSRYLRDLSVASLYCGLRNGYNNDTRKLVKGVRRISSIFYYTEMAVCQSGGRLV